MKKIVTNTRRYNFLLFILGIIPFYFAYYLLVQGITLPFVGYNAWNFNIYSLIAHNYNTFGLLTVQFAPVISVDKVMPVVPEYYFNHPPLQPLLQALSFQLFGESFASARLPVILASLGSMLLLFWIAKLVRNIRFGIVVLFVSSLIPATSIFGRMIGQEPVLLVFCLLTVISILKYEQTKRYLYILFAYSSVVLGSLTDWPMVYFTFCLYIYLCSRKMKWLGIGLLLVSISVACMYIMYASWLESSLQFLVRGFFNRSLGEVTKQSNWVFLWSGTFFLRFFLYFNPIFALFSLWFVFIEGKGLLMKRKTKNLLYLCLFFFGIVHILLYPEGSFGHPYWVYYLLPWVVLVTSEKLYWVLQKKQYFCLLVIFIASLLYVLMINTWKMNEIYGNLFRYKLANAATNSLPSYQSVLVNDNSLIDMDMLSYQFKIKSRKMGEKKDIPDSYKYVLYSCWNVCGREDKQLAELIKQFMYVQYKAKGAEMLVFFLKEPAQGSMLPVETIKIDAEVPENTDTLFKQGYRFIMHLFLLPQI